MIRGIAFKPYSMITRLTLLKWSVKDTIDDILNLSKIKLMLEIKVIDKNGNIIKIHKQHSHSFVENFLLLQANIWSNSYGNYSYNYNFIDISGTSTNLNNNTSGITSFSQFEAMNAPQNNNSYGIVVGTGTTPPTPSDYKLESQITNGTGEDQLGYGSMSFSTITLSGNTSSISISRTFSNNSGATITITEVGIIISLLNSNSTQDYVLIAHDLLSSAISVSNGNTLTINYTISITT